MPINKKENKIKKRKKFLLVDDGGGADDVIPLLDFILLCNFFCISSWRLSPPIAGMPPPPAPPPVPITPLDSFVLNQWYNIIKKTSTLRKKKFTYF